MDSVIAAINAHIEEKVAALKAELEDAKKLYIDLCAKHEPPVHANVVVYSGINYPTVSTAGPDVITLKGLTYTEALAKALELKCSIMVKKLHGEHWYLKGQNMDFTSLQQKIEFLSKRPLEPGSRTRTIYLIKY